MNNQYRNAVLEKAYSNYFNNSVVNSDNTATPSFTHTHEQAPRQIMRTNSVLESMPDAKYVHQMADAEEDSLEFVQRLLNRLVTAAWGTNWGVITLTAPTGLDPNEATLPCIVVDMNSRQVADKSSPKPKKLGITIPEEINGEKTGDYFEVYRMTYDCVLEFNFFGRNMMEARQLMTRFEKLMNSSAGVLKESGISEIFFLEEVSPTLSVNYVKGVAMRVLMYYYRFERDYVVRTSSLNRIQMEFEACESGA